MALHLQFEFHKNCRPMDAIFQGFNICLEGKRPSGPKHESGGRNRSTSYQGQIPYKQVTSYILQLCQHLAKYVLHTVILHSLSETYCNIIQLVTQCHIATKLCTDCILEIKFRGQGLNISTQNIESTAPAAPAAPAAAPAAPAAATPATLS